MDIKTYIGSGILEEYLSGGLSAQKRQEVECLRHIYPEIEEELEVLEVALEAFALEEAIAPPAFLRDRVLDAVDEVQLPDVAQNMPKLVTGESTGRASNRAWILLAVSILLLSGLSLYFAQTARTAKSTLETSKQKIKQLEADKQHFATQLERLTARLAILEDPNYQPIELAGLENKAPEAHMRVYWNTNTSEVYAAVMHMPEVANNKQYQLWALKDGKPIDLGVFDRVEDLQPMRAIADADAFAVTLEPKGGSPTPTLEEMYVLGEV